MFGYHVTGSTGTLFLYGIVVGAVALAGLSLLLAGARRTSRRGSAARRGLRQSRQQTAAVSQDRDDLIAQRDTARGAPRQAAAETPEPLAGRPPPRSQPRRPPPRGRPRTAATRERRQESCPRPRAMSVIGGWIASSVDLCDSGFHLACLDLSGPCAPSPLAVSR